MHCSGTLMTESCSESYRVTDEVTWHGRARHSMTGMVRYRGSSQLVNAPGTLDSTRFFGAFWKWRWRQYRSVIVPSPVKESTVAHTWGSGRLRWKRLRRAWRARWPPLKAGQPHPCIISTSRMMRSACLRQARKPRIMSTCTQDPDSAQNQVVCVPAPGQEAPNHEHLPSTFSTKEDALAQKNMEQSGGEHWALRAM